MKKTIVLFFVCSGLAMAWPCCDPWWEPWCDPGAPCPCVSPKECQLPPAPICDPDGTCVVQAPLPCCCDSWYRDSVCGPHLCGCVCIDLESFPVAPQPM